MSERTPTPEEHWDRFIDALDRAGQADGAQGVRVPAFGTSALGGRAFGELTRAEAQQLARIANALGRRGDTVLTLWSDTQARMKGRPRNARGRR
jgi:hypothetical protein